MVRMYWLFLPFYRVNIWKYLCRYSVLKQIYIRRQWGWGSIETLNSTHFILFKLILILSEMLRAALLQRTTEMFTLMIFSGKETDQKLSCFIFVIKLSKFVTIYNNKKSFVCEEFSCRMLKSQILDMNKHSQLIPRIPPTNDSICSQSC